MRKTRQFHPTRYDLLEDRLVLSRITIAASPPPGNTQTINPKLIVTPYRIESVKAGITRAFSNFEQLVIVARANLDAGKTKQAQFDKSVLRHLGVLAAQVQIQAARLPFGARDLYPRLEGQVLDLAGQVRAVGGRIGNNATYFAGLNAATSVDSYVSEGFASGKFYDSTKVHWTH